MKQTLLAIAFLVLILATGLVWYRYVRPPAGATASPDTVIDPARLAEYREMRRLSLDISVFSDPLFRILEAPTPPLAAPGASIPAGRADPFAPF